MKININELKNKLKILCLKISRKYLNAVLIGVTILALVITAFIFVPKAKNNKNTPLTTDSKTSEKSAVAESQPDEVSSSQQAESTPDEIPIERPAVISSTVSKAPETPVVPPAVNIQIGSGDYKYNNNLNIEDNVFIDALVYTGYNLAKQKSDGNMWNYILWTQKKGLGYLSKITYGGGCTGYETANGKPNISAFQKGGLVCASYVTYVYFNYLPNVAGLDTSYLPHPDNPTLADHWYRAVKKWVELGYSKSVPFTATAPKRQGCFLNFKTWADMPIGSLVIFRDAKGNSDHGSHVAIYTGYKNGYHWLHHVGNKNGPEMCAIERMLFGEDPQWPLYIVTPPENLRFTAAIDVALKDDSEKPISGVEFTLTDSKTNTSINLGATDSNGRVTKEGLNYGSYVLSQSLPEGYTTSNKEISVELTTKNNSLNVVSVTDIRIEETDKGDSSD